MSTGQRDTIAAYDAFAADYRDGTAVRSASVAAEIARFAAAVPAGARVLEIGSGPGHDAVALEDAGLNVRRTDVTPAFVGLLREAGHRADLLDPLTDDLDDPARPGVPYDAVWADACLLHVSRVDLPVVLSRLAAATRVGGVLHASLKEGDGDEWSTHGNVQAPRHFFYWRAEDLRAVLESSGWAVDGIDGAPGRLGVRWLGVRARRVERT